MDSEKSFYKYWGKALKGNSGENVEYHLLPYHCLDVAAVSDVWWQQSGSIRHRFIGMSGLNEQQTHAWLLFFIALHDYGKFDLRFQRKASEAWKAVNPVLSAKPAQLNGLAIKKYYHGPAGLYWLYQDLKERFASNDDFYAEDNDAWNAWYSWLAPVVGHHGIVPDEHIKDSQKYSLSYLQEELKQARLAWLGALAQLFLAPAGLSLNDTPPLLETTKNKQTPATLLAGFCAVSDWLGSSERFIYNDQPCDDLMQWYAPAIGFIHTGKPLSFVYDIADLFKFDDILPETFKIAAKNPSNPEREVRIMCREMFKRLKLLNKIIPTIEEVLAAGELEIPKPPEESIEPAIPNSKSIGDVGHRS